MLRKIYANSMQYYIRLHIFSRYTAQKNKRIQKTKFLKGMEDFKMERTENEKARISITAPVSGQIVPLEQVPDPVFSEKALGDGIAIIPENGKIYSPVNGTVATVAATKHAYGFQSEDGLDVLVHFGLETVGLNGEGFTAYKKEGDTVKAGDLVAEADTGLLQSKNLNLITPVLLCDGMDDKIMHPASGHVKAGQDAAIYIEETASSQTSGNTVSAQGSSGSETNDSASHASAQTDTVQNASAASESAPEKKKLSINFDFLQKLGKVLMTVIAVMPAAGLMLSIGKLIQIAGGDITAVHMVGSTMENIGWAIINNLHILFAAAIGGSWAKERAGGAFAAIISFILINCITGAVFGVTSSMLNESGTVVTSLFGQEMLVENYFTSVLGAPALNMGVFVGIIAGFVGGVVYNKYYNFRKLPDALSFFNGKRFVPLAVIAYSTVISLVMAVIWPVVQTGINSFGVWIANSSSTSPVFAPFIYGTLERLLLPFGLHHMLTIPMNYTSFGGTYMIQTGINAGSEVFGQDPLWLAWVPVYVSN